jgi:hypothetical protein
MEWFIMATEGVQITNYIHTYWNHLPTSLEIILTSHYDIKATGTMLCTKSTATTNAGKTTLEAN